MRVQPFLSIKEKVKNRNRYSMTAIHSGMLCNMYGIEKVTPTCCVDCLLKFLHLMMSSVVDSLLNPLAIRISSVVD